MLSHAASTLIALQPVRYAIQELFSVQFSLEASATQETLSQHFSFT